jgi:hypothetical protein
VVVFYSYFEPGCYEGAFDACGVGTVDRNFLVRCGIVGWAGGYCRSLVVHYILVAKSYLEGGTYPAPMGRRRCLSPWSRANWA